MSWQVELAPSAIRDLDSIPPRVVPAIIEFVYGSLAGNPRRLGKPLRDDFEGYWSARRSDYRVLFKLVDDELLITVFRIAYAWARVSAAVSRN